MSYQKSELYFLFVLLAGAVTLVFFVFQPFIGALILAVIFATVFSPAHKRILSVTRENRALSAMLATLFVLVVIVVPITFLSIQIFKEATQLYGTLANNGGAFGLSHEIEGIVRSLGFPLLPDGALDFSRYIKQGLSFLIQNLDTVFSNVAKIIVDIFILLVALYYLFKDGHTLKKSVIELSPLQDIYDETIFRKLELAVNSVVRGNISVAVTQGVLTTIGLFIFGVPNPVLWGSVAAIAALVPGFGTSLVLVPAILFLFFSSATAGAAIGLLVWWIVAVSLVDNVLGPRIVGRGVHLHPFLILLSILGGLAYFGAIGFLFGPLMLSLLFALLEIYSTIRDERSK